MDIKVGNDIKLNVTLPDYIDSESILNIKAILKKARKCKPCDFYHPSEYTITHHHCDYNTLPYNACNHSYDDYCNNRHKHCDIVVKHNGGDIFNVFVSNTTIHDCGSYELAVKIRVREDGWDCDNVHEYTVYYGPVFSISVDSNALEGRITINVNKEYVEDVEDVEESVLLYNDESNVVYNDLTNILLNESKDCDIVKGSMIITKQYVCNIT